MLIEALVAALISGGTILPSLLISRVGEAVRHRLILAVGSVIFSAFSMVALAWGGFPLVVRVGFSILSIALSAYWVRDALRRLVINDESSAGELRPRHAIFYSACALVLLAWAAMIIASRAVAIDVGFAAMSGIGAAWLFLPAGTMLRQSYSLAQSASKNSDVDRRDRILGSALIAVSCLFLADLLAIANLVDRRLASFPSEIPEGVYWVALGLYACAALLLSLGARPLFASIFGIAPAILTLFELGTYVSVVMPLVAGVAVGLYCIDSLLSNVYVVQGLALPGISGLVVASAPGVGVAGLYVLYLLSAWPQQYEGLHGLANQAVSLISAAFLYVCYAAMVAARVHRKSGLRWRTLDSSVFNCGLHDPVILYAAVLFGQVAPLLAVSYFGDFPGVPQWAGTLLQFGVFFGLLWWGVGRGRFHYRFELPSRPTITAQVAGVGVRARVWRQILAIAFIGGSGWVYWAISSIYGR